MAALSHGRIRSRRPEPPRAAQSLPPRRLWFSGPVGPATRAAGPRLLPAPLILAGITLLALGLRLLRLHFQPLWWDEGYSVWFATHSLAAMAALTAADIHPPLYYALLHGWIALFGTAPVTLRLFSVGVALPAIPLIYAAAQQWAAPARRTGVALLAAGLLAVNPFHVYYSQEIRMYGLVGTLALAYVWTVSPWINPGGLKPPSRTRSLALFLVTAGLAYTQYYAVILPLATALFVLGRAVRQRARVPALGRFSAAHLGAALVYVPWLVYTLPKLTTYVAEKVTQDADVALDPLTYLARHLSTFAFGHMAPGWLVWPAALLLLVFLFLALRGPTVTRDALNTASHNTLISYCLWILGCALLAGYALNLRFPFAPQRGERLLLFAAPAFWMLAAFAGWQVFTLSRHTLHADTPSHDHAPLTSPRPRLHVLRFTFQALGTLLLALTAFGLTAFYTTPRYADDDYRPIMALVAERGQTEDLAFCVYPWQVGYFRSYVPQGPQAVLSPRAGQQPDAAAVLHEALTAGRRVWFPEHLSLGGLLETRLETGLLREAYPVLNRWISPSTRLTFFVPEPAGWQTGPTAHFDTWLDLTASRIANVAPASGDDALAVDLTWQVRSAPDAATPIQVRLRLAGPDDTTWAQRDSVPANGQTPFAAMTPGTPAEDRHALWIPSGTPPGTYDLRLSVYREPATGPAQDLDVRAESGDVSGIELTLGRVRVSRPRDPPAADRLVMSTPLAIDLGADVRLLGFDLGPGPRQPGDDLSATLGWQVRRPLPRDLNAFLQLLDSKGVVAAAWEGPPLALLPTGQWQAGDLLRTPLSLRLPPTLADGRYRLISGLFDPLTGSRLQPAGQPHDYVALDDVTIRGRGHVMTPPPVTFRQEAAFSGNARLLGYDLGDSALSAGQPLSLTLVWRAGAAWERPARVFVHLLAADGRTVARADGSPAGGRLPTTGWLPGEFIQDSHVLLLPPDLPPGVYAIEIGFYFADAARLPVMGADGQIVADHLLLDTAVTVR